MYATLKAVRKWWKGQRLMRRVGVDISQSAKVDFQKIYMKDDCNLIIGEFSIVESSIMFDRAQASISIGKRTFIGPSQLVSADSIIIGNDVLISWGCTIVDHNSHAVTWAERKEDVLQWYWGRKNWDFVTRKSIRICDKTWIGFNSIILKGVTVGEGAVIGAGSVVTKDVPPYTVVAGNPARVIREISSN